MPDANRALRVEDDARLSGDAVIEEHAVLAASIFGDQPPGLVATDAHVSRRDVRVVDDHVIVVAAADARLVANDAQARRDLAVT